MGLESFKTDGGVVGNAKSSRVSKSELLDCLNCFVSEYDDYTLDNFRNDDRFCSSDPVYRHFETWEDALNAVGCDSVRSNVLKQDLDNKSMSESYVVGVLLGDGCLYKDDSGCYVKLSATDVEFVASFRYHFTSWTSISEEHMNILKTTGGSDGETNVWYVSKGVTDIYSYLDGILRMNANRLMNRYKPHLDMLIRGLWDSEGSVCGSYGGPRFSNSDSEIIKLYIESCVEMLDIERSEIWVSESDYLDVEEVKLPTHVMGDFYNTIKPTISRKSSIMRRRSDV